MPQLISTWRSWSLRKKVTGGIICILLIFYAFSLPRELFRVPYSTIVEDRRGQLLSARISADGQWRFPENDSLPANYVTALIQYEDRRFFFHPGVDPMALFRAVVQNLRNQRVVSGGSTLTMQVIRLSQGQKRRTIRQKVLEIILATRLELRYPKRKILRLYAAHAPFGGNVIGLEAASWRYFGKSPHYLSWAESALLAVLPNNPSLLHLGRNRSQLLEKRNRLLRTLSHQGIIDPPTLSLSLEEPLPEAPLDLPRLAPHLINRAMHARTAPRVRSTLDASLQQRALEVARRHHAVLRQNGIHNLSAIIAEVESGAVLAYIGNAPEAGDAHGEAVDITAAPRSSGSIFKPVLYALALQEGLILPHSLIPDVPTNINGYQPENFNKGFDGLVPISEALSRSLNVPFVRLLQQYDIARFQHRLQQLGLQHLRRAPADYGLTLILGGAECSLWDIAGVYASMARTLYHFPTQSGQYNPGDIRPLRYLMPLPPVPSTRQTAPPLLDAACIWFTAEAMQEVQRPDSEGEWQSFQSSRRIAWKTGTSFGFRDAWSVGITPEYVVAVWVGNADGEGRPGLIGTRVAAPFMFELFELLPGRRQDWFPVPADALDSTAVCTRSGWPAGPHCDAIVQRVPKGGRRSMPCPYCQKLFTDQTGQWQLHAQCADRTSMHAVQQMVLPPLEAYYYTRKHPEYHLPPPFRPDCAGEGAAAAIKVMQLIYPTRNARIYVPIDLDGQSSRTVFRLAHTNPQATVYWHIDNRFVGTTRIFHSIELNPPAGKHRLTVVDQDGNRLEQWFEIAGREQ